GGRRIARRHRLWFHVDASYGGPLCLSARYRGLLAGLGEADSVALDPHKWLYAPLDVGCVLLRDPAAARDAFPVAGEYAAVLAPGDRESHIFFGSSPELSRRFRALKVWIILKYHGTRRLAGRIEQDVALTRRLGDLIERCPETELLAPIATSVACFRYLPRGGRRPGTALDRLNRDLLVDLQAEGRVYLSNARIKGRFALRACLINFRTRDLDLRALLKEVVRVGRRLCASPARAEGRRTPRRRRGTAPRNPPGNTVS
ncbi:MAG: pyridoxal phosphate-dependent decarboxylase family protein, partial [Acidobacteriota bacterium]